MQERSELNECVMGSGKQSGNRPKGAHASKPRFRHTKIWGCETTQIYWYSLNRRKCMHFPG